jgi:hypothetical protein
MAGERKRDGHVRELYRLGFFTRLKRIVRFQATSVMICMQTTEKHVSRTRAETVLGKIPDNRASLALVPVSGKTRRGRQGLLAQPLLRRSLRTVDRCVATAANGVVPLADRKHE